MTASPYQHLPSLSPEEYAALRDDIREHGVLVPIEVDEDGRTLDGHHRRQICGELGITPPTVTRSGMSEAQKHEHALKLNLQRRNLTSAQKRVLIASELERDSDRSDRAIARLLGVDHKTVAVVRNSGPTGEFPQTPEPEEPSAEPEGDDLANTAADPEQDTKVTLLARKAVWLGSAEVFAGVLVLEFPEYAATLRSALDGARA